MTVDEFRNVLHELSDQQFDEFREKWGGAKATREETAQAFAYTDTPAQWERIIIFRLRQVSGRILSTEDEKLVAAARDSASAAQLSADAARESAKTAHESVGWSRWAVLVAALVGLASVVAAVYF